MSNVWYKKDNSHENKLLAAGIVLAFLFHAVVIYLFFMENSQKEIITPPSLPKAAPIVVNIAPQLESAQAISLPDSAASPPPSEPTTGQVTGLDKNPNITDAQTKVTSGRLAEKQTSQKRTDEKTEKKKPVKRSDNHVKRSKSSKDDISQSKNTQVNQANASIIKTEKNIAPVIGAESKNSADALKNWQSVVLSKLQAAKKYPPYALRTHMEDTILVRFLVNSAGEVSEAEVLKSAGYSLLDNETLSLISRVSPLPIPPETALVNGHAEIVVPIIFTIN